MFAINGHQLLCILELTHNIFLSSHMSLCSSCSETSFWVDSERALLFLKINFVVQLMFGIKRPRLLAGNETVRCTEHKSVRN